MPLDIDDLDFSSFAFEIRYTYLLWDRAGIIWKRLNKIFPETPLVSSQPNLVHMRSRAFELSWEPQRAVIQIFDPDQLKGAPRLTAQFGEVIASELELEEFTRVGLRWIRYKTFKDKESVAAAVLECGLLNIPEGRRFGVDGVVTLPEMSKTRGR
jgi:hypothetical protein